MSITSWADDSSYSYGLNFLSSECVADPMSLNEKKELHTSTQWFFILNILSWIEIWSKKNDSLQGENLMRMGKKQPLQTQCTCDEGIGNQTQATGKEGKFPMVSS